MNKEHKYHQISKIGFLIGMIPLALLAVVFQQIYIAIGLLIIQIMGLVIGTIYGNKSIKEIEKRMNESRQKFWNTYYNFEERKN